MMRFLLQARAAPPPELLVPGKLQVQVEASYDLWDFGLLVYQVLTGKTPMGITAKDPALLKVS